MMFTRITAAILVSMLSWVGAATADTQDGKIYHVLPMRDYTDTTGCDLRSFSHEMKATLRFLIFADSNLGHKSQDIHYAQRHSYGLFGDLYRKYSTVDNYKADRCMPPSWLEMGVDMALMHPATKEAENKAYLHLLKSLDTGDIDPAAYPVMSRSTYVAKTGCTVIPFQYNKYRVAFEWVTLYSGYDDRASDAMRGFLKALTRVNPGEGDYLDQKCLIPAIARVADEFNLLDDQGRYKSAQP
jgi:hypothetical protein